MPADPPAADPSVERDTDDELVDQDVERVSVRILKMPQTGWTLRPGYISPTTGTIVSLPTSAGFSFQIDLTSDHSTRDELVAGIAEFLTKALPYLARHDETYLGGWVSDKTLRLYLDVSERYDDHERASRLGRQRNQESVFRLSDMTTHDTEGDGT